MIYAIILSMMKKGLSVLAVVLVLAIVIGFGLALPNDQAGTIIAERGLAKDVIVTYDASGRPECDGLGIMPVPFGTIVSTCGKTWFVTIWSQVITLRDDGDIPARLATNIRENDAVAVKADPESFGTSRPAMGLPAGVEEAQIGDVYDLGIDEDALSFLFVLQKNMNTPLLELSQGTQTEWGGVLVSADDGAHWQSFLTYQNPTSEQGFVIRHNPVGMFVERGELFIDIADAAGAGSGEGHLTRFVLSNDHREWMVEGCYYMVPEVYFDEEDGRNKLSPSDACLPIPLTE